MESRNLNPVASSTMVGLWVGKRVRVCLIGFAENLPRYKWLNTVPEIFALPSSFLFFLAQTMASAVWWKWDHFSKIAKTAKYIQSRKSSSRLSKSRSTLFYFCTRRWFMSLINWGDKINPFGAKKTNECPRFTWNQCRWRIITRYATWDILQNSGIYFTCPSGPINHIWKGDIL